MKTKTQALPLKVSEYIQDHFREDFLFEVKDVKKLKGQFHYFVEVTKDDYIHSLQFNEEGKIINEVADEAFPTDIHEEQASGDVPD
jgi:hypothetical protein